MRSEKPAQLLRLARALAASAEGMTLDEMVKFSGVGRRTIERRRDAIEGLFGPLDRIEDGRQIRFRMNGRGLGSFAVAPTSEELAELENAARACERGRDKKRAEILRSLKQKIEASLRDGVRNRLAPDIDARLRSEAFARQAGPRPFADDALLGQLRQALLTERLVKFRYGDDGSPKHRHIVVPFGLIFGARYYLVASHPGKVDPFLFRLDRFSNFEVLEEIGRPPEDFNLDGYAARSFGVFQEQPENVVLRFDPVVADDAAAFLFHPTQTLTRENDGALTVRFTAGGLLEIAYHLMTWGGHVTILEPQQLKEVIWGEVSALHHRYRPQRRARKWH